MSAHLRDTSFIFKKTKKFTYSFNVAGSRPEILKIPFTTTTFSFANVQKHFLFYLIRRLRSRELSPRVVILSLHAPTVRNFVALSPRMSGRMFQCGTVDRTDSMADRKDRYQRCEEDLNPFNQTELHADPPPAASSEPQLAGTGETLLTSQKCRTDPLSTTCSATPMGSLFQTPSPRPQLSELRG